MPSKKIHKRVVKKVKAWAEFDEGVTFPFTKVYRSKTIAKMCSDEWSKIIPITITYEVNK